MILSPSFDEFRAQKMDPDPELLELLTHNLVNEVVFRILVGVKHTVYRLEEEDRLVLIGLVG